ncbi:hypothetical protein DB34_13350 [Acetobacter pasteurianus]|uniref:hypothetical protein n=1 Tax=Acetobacter pasteurianus TaxID=438 RepID=UPI000676C171|nr:hypothetical protein [Acetobacter pasteurianus]AKR49752.1 hypothetical protein DB34_13350 [Acetobacter pasteurianus]
MNRQEMLEALDKRVAEIKAEIESHQPDTQYAFAYGLAALDANAKMIDSFSGTLGDADNLLCAAGTSAACASAVRASVPPLFYLSRLNTAVLSFLMQGGEGAVIRAEDAKTVSDIFKNNGQSPAGARH